MNTRNAFLILVLVLLLMTGCSSARFSSDVGVNELPALAPEREPGTLFLAEERSEAFGGVEESEPSQVERLVIRNANLTVVVLDPAETVVEIGQLAERLGGFVVSSNIFQTAFEQGVRAVQGSIVIRVPAESLDETLTTIKKDAIEVRSEFVSGQDVTQEYTDLQSQLRNLEAAEEELLRIMDQATRAEDVLMVFENLRQVRQTIEVLKGRIQYFEQSARLSQVSVELIPDELAQPLRIGRWEPTGTAKAALEALISALQFLGNLIIWIVIFVLPIGVLLVPAVWVIRRLIRRRPKKQEEDIKATGTE